MRIADEVTKVTFSERSCLVHGDLYYRHLVFDERHRLTGIIDWGDAGISHPLVDYYVAFQLLAPEFQAVFFERLPPLTKAEYAYVRFMAFYSTVTMILYAEDINNKRLKDFSLLTLAKMVC